MTSRRSAWAVAGLAIVFAASRFQAIARSVWDWDEALFALSVLDYDVAAHQPHPPGYPLFVGAAKVLHQLGLHEFHALQAVVVGSALLLFPAAYLLARELGYSFRAAVAGAALLLVLPDVWVYGGTAFSDVPALFVSLVAAMLILRGRADRRAYIAGAMLAGIAAGMRTATLLVVAAPALVATWTRLRASRDRRARELAIVALSALVGIAIIGASYGGAALASDSVENYRWAVRVQSEWVRNVDSFLSPDRPNLFEVAKLFFVLPVQDKDLMFPIAGLALLGAIEGLARRRAHVILTVATFAPLMIFSWLMLDLNSVGRYAIAYLPLHAFLAAEALEFLVEPFARWRTRLPDALFVATAVAGVVAVGVWIWPSLRVVRKKPSPPFAALEWVRANVPDAAPVFVPKSFEPHARYLLRGRRYNVYADPQELSPLPSDSFIVAETVQPRAENFVRKRERLWKTVRARYFEASVRAVSNEPGFGGGWYGEEMDGGQPFRWMGREATILLPRVPNTATLRLVFSVPDAAPRPYAVRATFNGRLVEAMAVRGHGVERRWELPSAAVGENVLTLSVDAPIVPASLGANPDRRLLGLRLESVEWMPRKR